MAEFKLGRLRFVWQGTWTTGHNYVKDDVVSYGANTYVCLTGHTSSNTNVGFNDDLDSSNWQLMSSGVHWISSNWATATTYKENDIIKIGAKEYICINGHVSNATPDTGFYNDLSANNWSLFTNGTNWRSTWAQDTFYNLNDIVKVGGKEYICILQHRSTNTANSGFYTDLTATRWEIYTDGILWNLTWGTSTFYNKGDIVKYGAKDYICTTGHTSNATLNGGFYSDSANWQLLVDGLQWTNTWSASTPYYKIGDIALYGGIVYTCITGHAPSGSTLELDSEKWQTLTKGFNWIGPYTNGPTTYKLNDIVKYGADLYICTATAGYTTSTATIDLSKWSLFVAGLEYQSTYSAGTSYALGDVVTYGGYVYSSKTTNNLGNTPSTSTSNWDVVTTGFNTRGVWSSGASPTYKTGDVISYGAYVYVAILDNANTNPASDTSSWKLLTTGIYWTGLWAGSVSYKLGDAVTYASSSYICILAHTAGYTGGSPPATGTNNRPDVDTSGIYWNSLSQGAATNVTTTRGDLIYYSAAGNARLPIGTDGQVLKVVGSDPTWSTYGVIGNVYYVAPSGTDSTTYGYTIDKPWKTVAYACSQIKSGPANPNTQTQLLNNKAFLAAEVDNYITYTYKASVTGTSAGAFLTAATSGLTVGMPIRFSSLTGSLTFNAVALSTSTTYYVSAITLNTSFTVSASYLGVAGTSAGTGTAQGKFYYDSTKTVRDVKDLVDGFIFDIGRGGNVETVVNAGTYYIGETNYASTGIQQQVTQFVAGLTYLSTIVANIIAKTTPATNYQTLNSVGSPITQTTSGTAGEAGTTATVQSLITIITGSLSAGTTLAIPAMSYPNTTLYVKTGTYSEILPIKVPAFTSIVGDELRSTVIQPYTFTVTTSGSTSSGSSTILLTSASGIVYGAQYTGMGIVGSTFIPDGTYISNVATNTITLSIATTGIIPTGTVLTVGYSMSHMFQMRDGTVARNMTVKGLFGGLGTANVYGTKRPTGSSYFSLDPGTGTTDETVWITSRSPYMQNISLIGTGSVGMKVDGSLHGGGNKSMLANDFTNIISDGIAVWCSNLALVEAVSVFSYYGYAGYLAETGGKIRATNGNSSYGTYGVVAEGTASTETPITATVNTQSTGAQVTYAMLGNGPSGIGQPLWLEYSNAGQTYSSSAYVITSGTGVSAAISSGNYFTNGITEVRIYSGGAGYSTATNVAQSGTTTTLTLSAADTASTGGYVGMRAVLYNGTGAGQYGYINYYNGSTKQAIVLKESVAAITTTTCSTSVYTVSSTLNISIGTPIVFTGTTFGGVSLNTVYWVVTTGFTTTQFGIATSLANALAGTAVTLSATTGSMLINVAGWDAPNLSTSYATALLTAQSATIADNSSNGFTLANTGSVASSSILQPFGGTYSYGFSGTNYLQYTSSTYSPTTNNFTIEGWIRTTSTATQGIFSLGSAYSSPSLATVIALSINTSGAWTLYANNASTSSATGSWAINTWYHFAIVRSTTTTTLWVNGVALITVTGDSVNYSGQAIDIGVNGYTGLSAGLIGNLSNFRLINNNAVYTTTFTPSNSALGTTSQYNGIQSVLDGTTRYVIEPRITFSNTSGTGALVRAVVSSNQITAIRVINPGTGYATAITVTATAITNNQITAANSLVANQTVIFTSSFSGIVANTYYYVSASNLSGTGFSVTSTPSGSTVTITATGVVSASGTAGPSITVTDPNASTAGKFTVRTAATGVLGQPTYSSRGSGYIDATLTITGNGYADFQATGLYINVSNLTAIPVAGSNIVFAGNSTYYIVVQVLSYSGSVGNYNANIQINPATTVSNAPANGTAVTITIQYSQARLTGHDFLYVGSGNFYSTGYPNNFSTANLIAANQTVNSGGGRVFFTATDQDGNFNVGNLFNVAQATGVATLNASLFNLSGLNQLQFVSGGATITQFSTDGTMNLNSDALVPTQRAVRAYIASQLGAGGSNISANSLTAGSVYLSGTTITTTNSNNLTLTTTGTTLTITGTTTTVTGTTTNLNATTTVITRGQSSYAATTGNDLINKTYIDTNISTKTFAYFMSR